MEELQTDFQVQYTAVHTVKKGYSTICISGIYHTEQFIKENVIFRATESAHQQPISMYEKEMEALLCLLNLNN